MPSDAEKQVFKLKKELLECDIERKSLLEDLYGIKYAQQENNKILRSQKNEIDMLLKELAFYKEESTRAISDRDAMAWEIESLRRDLEAAKGKVLETSSSLATVEEERDVLKQRLDESESMVCRLEKVAATAELLPVLQRDLRRLEHKAAELQTQVTDSTQERDSLRETLDRERLETEEEICAMKNKYEDEVEHLNKSLQASEMEMEQTQSQLVAVTAQKVQALVDKADAESRASKHEQDLIALRHEMAILKQNLATATREKVQALVERADVEAQLSGSTSKASSVAPSPFTSPLKKRLEF